MAKTLSLRHNMSLDDIILADKDNTGHDHFATTYYTAAIVDDDVGVGTTEMLPATPGKRWFIHYAKIQVIHSPTDTGTGYTIRYFSSTPQVNPSVGSLHFRTGVQGQGLWQGIVDILCAPNTNVVTSREGGSFSTANANVFGFLVDV